MSVLPLQTVIGSYRIEKLVGSGGMGEVYRAIDLRTRMPVAVKALTQTGGADTALARFRNEAVIQYNLHHPNVAELYEYFEYQGKPCIVMEFIDGRTLAEWIREAGPLDVPTALEIMADICDAVSYMHAKGTIHRDIKSENIRINAQGKAKLLDFGISVSRETPAFTRTGYSIGTPEKMAPEQHLGLRGDARSDVWSLGVLFYEVVTGAQPFASNNEAGLREDIVAARYISASKRRPTLPKGVSRIISNCLRPKPDERYASSGVLLREIQQLRRGLPTRQWATRLAHPAVVAGTLGVVALLLLIFALNPARNRTTRQQSEPPLTPSAGLPGSQPGSGDPNFPDPSPVRIPLDAAASSPKTDAPATPRTGAPTPSPKTGAPPAARPAIPSPNPGASIALAAPNTPVASNSGDTKTVLVSTYDGPANVLNKDGQVLGSTPYRLTGPRGTNYELWLSRPGFQPRKIYIEINNKNEYLFGLEKED